MLEFLKELLGKTTKFNIPDQSNIDTDQDSEDFVYPPNENIIDTRLSLNELWEKELNKDQKYTLNFIHSGLPKIKYGAVYFHGFHVEKTRDGYRAYVFIRNGLDKSINLEEAPLTLVNDGKIIASNVFKFEEMGEIPPKSSRPWIVEFEGVHVFDFEVAEFNSWTLRVKYVAPQAIRPNQLQLTPEWQDSVSEEQIKKILEIMQTLPPMPIGKIQFVPIDIDKTKNGELIMTLLIRNGYKNAVELRNTPLMILDNQKGNIASGIFNLEGITLRPGSSMPWNFRFSKENILSLNFDKENLEVVHGLERVNK